MDKRTERKHIFSLVFIIEFEKDINLENIFLGYIESLETKSKEELNNGNKSFVFSSFEKIFLNLKKIDKIISENLIKREIERLNKVDLAILRFAVYEIILTDTPKKIIINEAIEIAKEFSSENSPKFINGVLATFVNSGQNNKEL
ncbi:MAG: transcription antitermination factor NusB [Defluviitaleaceae bacterium]|nr:transcription antitermination factor NusB [Defluviitaleaceae bacterium]